MADLVALNTMLPKFDSPFDQQGKAMQLRQLMAAGQQSDYEAQQRQQAQADDASYRQALQSSAGDSKAMLSSLAGAGNYKGYAAAQKADLDQRKGNTDIEKDKATTQKTQIEALNQAFTLHRDQINMVNDPQTAAQWVAAAYKDPVLGPLVSQSGPLEDAIKRIPTDPKLFAAWKLQAGTSADEYVKRTTVDANTKARVEQDEAASKRTAESSRYATNATASTAAARLKFDKEKESGGEDAALGPMATRMIAQQYLAGDSGALGNIGRGAQGAKNLTIVRNEIARQANAAGLNGADIAAKVAEFGGAKAGQRTLGTRTANIEVAAAEAAELAPLALDASSRVARSGILPFGKAQIMFDANTNNPDLREFAMANNALVNAFGQVMSRGGAATVSDKEHARELLSTAFDQPSYARAVAQLQKEIDAARKAPTKVRKEMNSTTSGRASEQGDGGGKVIDFGSLK